jgi:hypothetical protein
MKLILKIKQGLFTFLIIFYGKKKKKEVFKKYVFSCFFSSISDNIGNCSHLKRYEVCEAYSTKFFDCQNPSRRFNFLFNYLVDLYRTGQLLIPQLIIDVVRAVEENICLKNYAIPENVIGIDEQSLDIIDFIRKYNQGTPTLEKNYYFFFF